MYEPEILYNNIIMSVYIIMISRTRFSYLAGKNLTRSECYSIEFCSLQFNTLQVVLRNINIVFYYISLFDSTNII